MPRGAPTRLPRTPAAVRRGYFECRWGQLHVHNTTPAGGGFEEGTPLLCVHDLPGSARVLVPVLASLGQDRPVYAPDLPGCGESDPPEAPPSIADYAAALGDFVDSMRLKRLDVMGLRGGTLIATELALERRGQVGRVVLVSVPLLRTGEHAASPPGPADGAMAGGGDPLWPAQAAAQYPLRARLARIAQPLLAVRLQGDLWEATARVREVLPAARLTALGPADNASGLAAEPLAGAVREFLRD